METKGLLGRIVHNEEEAYGLYRDYGYTLGFSIRKGKNFYLAGTKTIRTKEYICSKEGFKNDERPNEATYNRPDTRTGCLAKIRFTVDEEGRWVVTYFNDEHNHEFAMQEERHLLRSVRSVSVVKAGVLDSMVNAGIRPINAYSYLAEECGGAESLGLTKKDCYNYINKQKMMLIEAGDSQSLVNHFKCKANEEDGMFYWDVQLDHDGRMTNFYWRDGRSRIDYDYFGDVVVFDTTYRTNRYNLVCAPFVGVNHHWQNVIFGCAFLLNETIASFEWLFKTFLESMGDRAPKTIFTDQDQAMAKAIEKVLPNTSHRLCLWHISKNAPSHLGGLNSDRVFHKLFHKCLQGCETEEEFEETWAKMISEYNLKNHKWLNNLYKIRKKWCTALNKDIFDGGIKASQRSESTNNVLNGIADKSTSLTKFVIGFENLIKRWRRNEADEDYRCHQSSAPRANKYSGIFKHASGVYTHKLYKLFEREYIDGCLACDFEETPCGDTLYKFELMMEGRGSNKRVVYVDTNKMDVKCTCKKFEWMGILCSHALAALHTKHFKNIPEQYIVKRWTKDAKTRVYTYSQGESSQSNSDEAGILFRNSAMRFAYDLVTMSQGQEEARKIIWSVLNNGHEHLTDFFKKSSLDGHLKDGFADENVNEITNEDNEAPVLNPPRVRPKGVSSSRLKGHFEKQRKKSSREENEKTNTRKRKQPTEHMRSQNLKTQEVTPSTLSPPATIVAQPLATPPSQSSLYQVYPNNYYMPQFCYPMHNLTPQMTSETSTDTWNLSGSNVPSMEMLQRVNFVNNLSQNSSTCVWRPFA